MTDPQVLVSAKFVERVRLLTIRLAQLDDQTGLCDDDRTDRYRQFIEGYLGVDRAELACTKPEVMEAALLACGLATKADFREDTHRRCSD